MAKDKTTPQNRTSRLNDRLIQDVKNESHRFYKDIIDGMLEVDDKDLLQNHFKKLLFRRIDEYFTRFDTNQALNLTFNDKDSTLSLSIASTVTTNTTPAEEKQSMLKTANLLKDNKLIDEALYNDIVKISFGSTENWKADIADQINTRVNEILDDSISKLIEATIEAKGDIQSRESVRDKVESVNTVAPVIGVAAAVAFSVAMLMALPIIMAVPLAILVPPALAVTIPVAGATAVTALSVSAVSLGVETFQNHKINQQEAKIKENFEPIVATIDMLSALKEDLMKQANKDPKVLNRQ